MALRIKWTSIFILISVTLSASCHGAMVSTCGETNVGIPLKGIEKPEEYKNSNAVISALGAPFFATYVPEDEKDVLVYVDGYFRGAKTVTKSTDPTMGDLYSSRQQGCGVAIIFTFSRASRSVKITALDVEDLMKAHASKFSDTTWANPGNGQ
jgi:hypothetical protein